MSHSDSQHTHGRDNAHGETRDNPSGASNVVREDLEHVGWLPPPHPPGYNMYIAPSGLMMSTYGANNTLGVEDASAEEKRGPAHHRPGFSFTTSIESVEEYAKAFDERLERYEQERERKEEQGGYRWRLGAVANAARTKAAEDNDDRVIQKLRLRRSGTGDGAWSRVGGATPVRDVWEQGQQGMAQDSDMGYRQLSGEEEDVTRGLEANALAQFNEQTRLSVNNLVLQHILHGHQQAQHRQAVAAGDHPLSHTGPITTLGQNGLPTQVFGDLDADDDYDDEVPHLMSSGANAQGNQRADNVATDTIERVQQRAAAAEENEFMYELRAQLQHTHQRAMSIARSNVYLEEAQNMMRHLWLQVRPQGVKMEHEPEMDDSNTLHVQFEPIFTARVATDLATLLYRDEARWTEQSLCESRELLLWAFETLSGKISMLAAHRLQTLIQEIDEALDRLAVEREDAQSLSQGLTEEERLLQEEHRRQRLQNMLARPKALQKQLANMYLKNPPDSVENAIRFLTNVVANIIMQQKERCDIRLVAHMTTVEYLFNIGKLKGGNACALACGYIAVLNQVDVTASLPKAIPDGCEHGLFDCIVSDQSVEELQPVLHVLRGALQAATLPQWKEKKLMWFMGQTEPFVTAATKYTNALMEAVPEHATADAAASNSADAATSNSADAAASNSANTSAGSSGNAPAKAQAKDQPST